MAVRSSCSIPLFFEPVQSGNDFLIDGGILSNLPTFVFAKNSGNESKLGGRILSFQLQNSEISSSSKDLWWLIQSLIDTVISGATDLQTEIQGNINTVNIDTKNIPSIDFDISEEQIKNLRLEGRKAVKDFIENEHDSVKGSLDPDMESYGRDELYHDIVREMDKPGSRLLVCCDDVYWFWKLFPSVAHWIYHGAQIDVLAKPIAATSDEHEKEEQRRDYLRKIGATIKCQDDIPTKCFILLRNDERHNSPNIRVEQEKG